MASPDVLIYLSELVETTSWQILVGVSAFITSVFILFPYLRGLSEQPVIYSVPVPEQADPKWKGSFIDEPTLKVHGSNLINCYDPSTGYSLGQVLPASASDIDHAIAAAARAQQTWCQTSFTERRRVLNTILRFVLDNQLSIARVCARDCGKPLLDASLGELLVTAEKLKWTTSHGEAALKPSRRPTNFLLSYKRNTVRYEPLGVVAACVSWNYPFHNFISPVIAALFAGDAIVVKPSERTAWSTSYFLSIVRGALKACGHSEDLVHALLLWPQTADKLTSHLGISHITFIGSQAVAKHVVASAGTALIPVCAELGGKDPAIVLDDIDSVERIAEIILRGTFQGAGQNCIGVERVIALPGSYDRLVEYFTARIKTFRIGSALSEESESKSSSNNSDSGIDMGALISPDAIPRLESLIAEAVSQGATLITGGTHYTHPKWPKGHYFLPTLITDVTPSMRLAQTELFAPICTLMRAPTVAAALEIANSTPYALGSSVFGTNRAQVNTVVAGLKAGMVAVNDFGSFYMVQMPFGGVKGSGYGRFAGEEGLRGLSNLKAVCEDRWGALGIRTAIPPVYHYPVDVRKAWRVAESLVRLGYGLRWSEMGWGLLGVLGNMARSAKK